MDELKTQKRKKFLLDCVYYVTVFILTVVAARYALPVLLPFVIAFIVALLVKPLVDGMEKKWRFKRSIASIILVVLFYAVIGVLLGLVCMRVVQALEDIFSQLPALYTQRLSPALEAFFDGIEAQVQRFDADVVAAIDTLSKNLITSLGQLVADFSRQLVNYLTRTATSLPGLFIKLIITILSTYFILSDYGRLRAWIMRQLPEKTFTLLHEIKSGLGKTLMKYLKSYLLIMFITFLELLLGLSIIRVENAFVIALVIAIFDIFPIIGSGLFLFPWAVLALVQGNVFRGVGLLVLWIIMIIVRNIMEPRIVGDHVGLHPLVTVMAMTVGTYLFGAIGLLGLPVALALMVSLNEQGKIHLFK